jgi:hypothetical protein
MKNILKFGLLALMVPLLVTSCDPQEFDEYELGSQPQESQLDFTMTPSSSNPNIINFVDASSRPGIANWTFGNGVKGKGSEVVGVYPSKGTYDVVLTLVTDGGYETTGKTVTVEQDDYSLVEPDLRNLVRDSEGKDWVFGGTGGDGGLWYFMSEGGNPDGHMSAWWNTGGTCCPPPDVDGKMHFNIVGGSNYLYYESSDAEPVEGSFSFNTEDPDNMTLTLTGADILGHITHEDVVAGSDTGTYQVMSITEDKLVLYTPSNGYGTGWTWVFVPAE